MSYNPSIKLKQNIEAIRLALEWDGITVPGRQQAEVLKQYCGFGGLKALLYGAGTWEDWEKAGASASDLKLYDQFAGLHKLLDWHLPGKERKAIMDAAKQSVLTAYYTPPVVPATFYNILKRMRIVPDSFYDPSCGMGAFLTEALAKFPDMGKITVCEKDILTAKVLKALLAAIPAAISYNFCGFEETTSSEDGKYDLITSNIPFGNMSVYDPSFSLLTEITGRIHNYFFAKGLEKLRNGGLLAYLVTNAFLDSPGNKAVREYLFRKADFVSVAVMPDNLMKDSANTEAPSHFLVVQKNTGKDGLSDDEQLLIETIEQENEFGTYSVNSFIAEHPESIIGDVKPGKNQYGKPCRQVWLDGDISHIAMDFGIILATDFGTRYLRPVSRLNTPPKPLAKPAIVRAEPAEPIPAPIARMPEQERHIILKEPEAVENPKAAIAEIVEATPHVMIVSVPQPEKVTATAEPAAICFTEEISQLHYYQPPAEEAPIAVTTEKPQLAAAPELFARSMDEADENEVCTVHAHHRPGSMVYYRKRIVTITGIDPDSDHVDVLPYEDLTEKNEETLRAYIKVRDAYFMADGYEKNNGQDDPALRKALRKAYDEFVTLHGILNKPANRTLIMKDAAHGFLTLASLEVKRNNEYFPADVLNKSIRKEAAAFGTSDPVEALMHYLGVYGQVNLKFIAETTGIIDEKEILAALGDRIYLNPLTGQWEMSDKFLSGNVHRKLTDIQRLIDDGDTRPETQRALAAIKEVQPEKIPWELLEFNLGERWIPAQYYTRFASWLFEGETIIHYFPYQDTFKVEAKTRTQKMYSEFQVMPKAGYTVYGNELMENALVNTTPFFTYEVPGPEGTKIRVPDNDAIQLANEKIDSIRNSFVTWLGELPDADKNYLVDTYNNLYNCYVIRKYDGSHMKFPGLDLSRLGPDNTPLKGLYESQSSGAWRIIEQQGGIIDHEVGTGKTLLMTVASYEMKRMGIRRKPVILALKSTVSQIVDTYRRAYPGAKVLAPSEKDFEREHRLRLFHEIKNNDWDCVIMTHDQFGKIPQSLEIMREILQEELDNLERDLEAMEDAGHNVSRRMRRGLEIRKNNLSAALKSIMDKIESKKDAGITFEDMGIDHILVDEAHKFKNLTFTTRHDRVAGLGNMQGSQKALNMLYAIRTLQKRFNADVQATFLTGTPISNSLTEMYLLFKFLRPGELERQNILNFDSWAAVFAKKTTDFEFSVTNQIIAKERFRHFIKVPELALFYNEIADYRTNKSINIDRPEAVEELVPIKPTPDQKDFILRLIRFAKNGFGPDIFRRPLTDSEDKARMLIATNYAKKMSADMRLISTVLYGDHPDNKVNTCCRKVAEFYHSFKEHRGTQLIFSDIGTPKDGEFNVYDAIRDKLVTDFAIPKDEIAFIHDYNEKTRMGLFEKIKKGIVRILLGSTDKAGTGVNVQDRVVALHHLDIPWKPAELEQRSGRGVRQGNWVAKLFQDNRVYEYIYAVEQSLDNYKFTLLKNKQTFISQMKRSGLSVRSIDEGSLDESNGMNFAEYIAILSGDTSLLEKAKVDKKLAVLENLRSAHYREVHNNKYVLEHKRSRVDGLKEWIEVLNRDQELYTGRLTRDENGTKNNPVHLDGIDLTPAPAKPATDTEPEVPAMDTAFLAGTAIINLQKTWKPKPGKTHQKIGSLYGFDLFIERTADEEGDSSFGKSTLFVEALGYNRFYAQHPDGGMKYTYNHGLPNKDNPRVAARHFLNSVDRVGSVLEKYVQEQHTLLTDISVLERLVEKSFARQGEIEALKLEAARLEREIKIKIQSEQQQSNVQIEAEETEYAEAA